MFRIPRDNPWPPQIDLSTLRETLVYMHDDMSRMDGMEKLRDALAVAIKEAEIAEYNAKVKITSIINARFLPRRH